MVGILCAVPPDLVLFLGVLAQTPGLLIVVFGCASALASLVRKMKLGTVAEFATVGTLCRINTEYRQVFLYFLRWVWVRFRC